MREATGRSVVSATAVTTDEAVLDPNRWRALAVAGAAAFVTVLDMSIVTVALPSIGLQLQFSPENLQWVVTAYAITFGGLLMLGGRLADLFGRRRLFMIGLALFTAASLLCGFAGSEAVLIAARALQGVGAAMVSPAALAIVSAAFTVTSERNRAFAVWGAIAGSAAAIGVVLGGILTKYLGWEWIFFVNVPIGAAVLVLTPLVIRESRVEGAARDFDLAGALSISASLALFVYGLSKSATSPWGSAEVIGSLIAGAVLLVAFVLIEMRARSPLLPQRLLRLRTVAGANGVALLVGAAIGGIFFLLTLYMQNVLGYSPLQSGLSFLTFAGCAVVAAGGAEALMQRLGPTRVMAIGPFFIVAALVWFTQVTVDGSFTSDLLPGFALAGIGSSFVYVPVSIIALAGVEERDLGLASGLINTTEQVSGAVGVAIVSSVFASRVTALLEEGEAPPVALTQGFQAAFWVGVAIAGLTAVAVPLFLWHPHVHFHLREHSPYVAAPVRNVPSRAATATALRAITGVREPTPESAGAEPSG
jgi:EmrB/QacA subfamily drug resistance transporter